MKLGSNIKRKSFLWNLLPWINQNTLQAIYPNIYLPSRIYDNLISSNPDPFNIARLKHEETHLIRAKLIGPFNFYFKYIFIPKFRFEEEIEANKVAMKLIKSQGLTWNIKNTAKHLSSWLYFWPVTFTHAEERLNEVWRKLQ